MDFDSSAYLRYCIYGYGRYEAVTLPDNEPADLGEFEQHLQFSNSETLMGMHKSAYIDMVKFVYQIDKSYYPLKCLLLSYNLIKKCVCFLGWQNLDNIDDSYISHNQGEADLPHDHHQGVQL